MFWIFNNGFGRYFDENGRRYIIETYIDESGETRKFAIECGFLYGEEVYENKLYEINEILREYDTYYLVERTERLIKKYPEYHSDGEKHKFYFNIIDDEYNSTLKTFDRFDDLLRYIELVLLEL